MSNNAGVCPCGEVEAVLEDVARKMFEIHFWGALVVTQEAVAFFRELHPPGICGRLIQASLVVGITGYQGFRV
jgi:NAD(P)-dependent dehydrogenase (short-subunit alcohol dehydrogenase family)